VIEGLIAWLVMVMVVTRRGKLCCWDTKVKENGADYKFMGLLYYAFSVFLS
jgi:hypothetical protein